ncbi:MAG: Holliday junction resolvase RecU [Bacilli bacterium]|nr:Holliday junction resolvase RecU [Bacilli bacterium]
MIKYPNGSNYTSKEKSKKKTHRHLVSASNRGMLFEDAINKSNEFYIERDVAVITKRPTPINVVKVDYTKGAKIINAYFEKQSTTDYNGVYKGHYLDFEAKSTKIKTSFPLNNITSHQIKHLERVIRHHGIAFFLIEFASLHEVYYLDAQYVIDYYRHEKRKSIPLADIKKYGHLIKRRFCPIYHYLEIVDQYLK